MAFVQRRKGPDVVGCNNPKAPTADGVKLILKEPISPSSANFSLFRFLFAVPVICLCCYGTPITFTDSELFTYTSDMLEDSASSEHSNSTSAVNQPLPGEQAMPVMPQQAAPQVPPYVRFPYQENEIIGGDSVAYIERRLLGRSRFPSAHEIFLARIQAQDLFEVKADIIRHMSVLHPSGDWMGRGARALDNPRTATGEADLSVLYRMLSDLQTRNLQSATFRLLVERVPLRADEDNHSAT